MTKRTILIIVTASVVVIAVAIAVYFLLLAPKNTLVVAPNGATFGLSGDQANLGGAQDFNTQESAPTAQEVAPRFVKISSSPVAKGVVVVSKMETAVVSSQTASSSASIPVQTVGVRYVERATGNIYNYSIFSRTLSRISNQTLPGVVDVAWSLDGAYAFSRYLTQETGDMVQTYALAEDSNQSYFFEEGLEQVLVTPEGLVLTLLPSSTGSIATLAKPDGTSVRTLFSSPLSSIRLAVSGSDYLAYTKASAGSSGYVFKVDGKTGSFERVAGPHPGLTALPSPSGKTILLGYRSGNSLKLELFDVATRISTALPVATLPEKCAWSADETELYCGVPRALGGTLPDSWYQGGVTLSDRFWKIDVENRLASLLFDPEQLAEVSIDAVSPVADSVSRSLIFTNKTDGSLWLYEL